MKLIYQWVTINMRQILRYKACPDSQHNKIELMSEESESVSGEATISQQDKHTDRQDKASPWAGQVHGRGTVDMKREGGIGGTRDVKGVKKNRGW